MLGLTLTWVSFIGVLFVMFQIWGTGVVEYQAQSNLSNKFNSIVPTIDSTAMLPGASITTTTQIVPTNSPTTLAPAISTDTTLPALTGVTSFEQSTETINRVTRAAAGDVIARIMIPAIGLDKIVVEGAATDELRSAIGRYRGTAFLGGKGNASLAGHRTTYGAPFGRINELLPGDKINLLTPVGTAIYEVLDPLVASKSWAGAARETNGGYLIVGPSDEFVLADVKDNRLTLTACHPKFSAEERIIVVAQLIGEPFEMLDPDFGASSAPTTPSTPGVDESLPVSPPVSLAPEDDPSSNLYRQPQELQTLQVTLNGLPNQFAPSLVFALMTLVVMTAIAVAVEKFGRLRAYVFGSMPFLIALWFLFRQIELLLPAY